MGDQDRMQIKIHISHERDIEMVVLQFSTISHFFSSFSPSLFLLFLFSFSFFSCGRCVNKEKTVTCWVWQYTHLIPGLQRQRRVHLCEFKSILFYRVSSKTVTDVTQRNHVSKQRKCQPLSEALGLQNDHSNI